MICLNVILKNSCALQVPTVNLKHCACDCWILLFLLLEGKAVGNHLPTLFTLEYSLASYQITSHQKSSFKLRKQSPASAKMNNNAQ